MNINVIYSWVGRNDLGASKSSPGEKSKLGPIADFLLHTEEVFSHAVLLFDHEQGQTKTGFEYLSWLNDKLKVAGNPVEVVLKPKLKGDPTAFDWVFGVMRGVVADFEAKKTIEKRHYLVGPGTSTMAACTLIVSRMASCAGRLWQVDERGDPRYRALELPFDLQLKDAPDPQVLKSSRFDETQDQSTGEFIVKSPSTRKAWGLAKRAATCAWPVLILGSTGTGKEGLARAVHQESGLGGQFCAINCGAIPENLIESTLFGHKKGAFTGATQDHEGVFETAKDGTVFLDELGELPLLAQVKLLRVLQEKKVVRVGENTERLVNCRVLAATHKNLMDEVRSGRFRADLYYRLAGIIIELSDLAERQEDLNAMIGQFWADIVQENPGFPGKRLGDDAKARLMAHPWAGNVRELRASLVRASFLAESPYLGAADIELALVNWGEKVSPATLTPVENEVLPIASAFLKGGMKARVQRYRQEMAAQALSEAKGNKSLAARQLEISVQHLGLLLKA